MHRAERQTNDGNGTAVRLLTPEDAAAYWQLRLRALQDAPYAFSTTYEEAIQRARPVEVMAERLQPSAENWTVGSFTAGGELVGVVTFAREQMRKLHHKGTLTAMYVSPDMRGRGVARALVAELLDRARTLDGLEQINLTVVTTNDAAYRLYSATGFRVFGVEPYGLKYDHEYWDEEYMVIRFADHERGVEA